MKDVENNLTVRILRLAFKQFLSVRPKNYISYEYMSKCSGIKKTTLWYCVQGLRKWSAEGWLRILIALGFIEVLEDGFKIKVHIDDDLKRELSRNIDVNEFLLDKEVLVFEPEDII